LRNEEVGSLEYKGGCVGLVFYWASASFCIASVAAAAIWGWNPAFFLLGISIALMLGVIANDTNFIVQFVVRTRFRQAAGPARP
jgi:hypothetical protein